MINLKDITEENWREHISVYEEQKKYVSDPDKLLARAYAYRNFRSQAKMIYADDKAVGMVLYYDLPEFKGYDIAQLFIDKEYQGRGYGSEAMKQVIELMRNDGKYKDIYLCYIEGNEAACKLYTKLGFHHTGDVDEDEILMVYHLED